MKDMSTTPQAQQTAQPPPARPGQQAGGEHLAGFIYASVWLVFLVVPIIAVFHGEHGLLWEIIVCVATLVFALVYCQMAWRWFAMEEDEPSWKALSGAVGVLGLIALVPALEIGPWAVSYTPYMAALVIFTRPPLAGIPLGVLIWALPSAAALFLLEFQTLWVAAGPGIGMVFIVAMRITEYYETKGRKYSEQLRAAEERGAIARDVHDVLGHSLTVLTVKAQLARRLMESDPDRARHEIQEIERLSRQSLEEVRATVSRLKSPQLPSELEVARSTLESAGITAEIHSRLEESGPSVLAWALREAVTNVVRHSGASRCQISITAQQLRVADDGVGLADSREGNGLRGLRERAQAAGAGVVLGRAYPELEGTSPDRPGTQIEVRLR